MVYQDFPVEQGQLRFEELKNMSPEKRYIPIVVSKPKIRIPAENK
jgi:hypothetical protein